MPLNGLQGALPEDRMIWMALGQEDQSNQQTGGALKNGRMHRAALSLQRFHLLRTPLQLAHQQRGRISMPFRPGQLEGFLPQLEPVKGIAREAGFRRLHPQRSSPEKQSQDQPGGQQRGNPSTPLKPSPAGGPRRP